MAIVTCVYCSKYYDDLKRQHVCTGQYSVDTVFAEPVKVATRYDSGKYRISILMGLAFELVMKVGEFGAGKYGDDNYRDGMPITKFLNAAFRHVFIEFLFKGRDLDIDPDCKQCQTGICTDNPDPKKRLHSGLPHLAHGAWNLLAAAEQQIRKPEFDDRYYKESR